MQGLLPGSVSKYCLQHSPVPVIVVRPSSKRLKKKKKRQQESGRSLYSSMVDEASKAGGRHLHDKNATDHLTTVEATQQEADAVAKAIGAPKRGILKPYGGPLARVTSNKTETSEDDFEAPQPRFALPIGYLTTESAPRADLAMQSESIRMLEEDWDEATPPRSRSPASGTRGHQRSSSDAAISDVSDDEFLGVAKVVEKRRPSTRESNPWLADILRDKPAKRGTSPMPRSKSPGHGRNPSR